MQKQLFKEAQADWPEHSIPARLDASEAGRDAARSCKRVKPRGMLAARAGAREVVLQRSAPDDSSYTGTPPDRTEGDIRGFSASSRTRMRQQIQRLSRDAHGLFLTLTYHESDPTGQEVKAHLHAFVQALRRRWDGLKWSMIWRLEYQKRGVPHLHMLISGICFEHMDVFKRIWHRITDEKSREHREMGAFVERWPGGSKLSSYVAKYMAKEGVVPDDWQGRVWGVRNRRHLPECPVTVVYRIPYDVAYRAALAVWEAWGMDDKPLPYSLRIWTEDPTGTVNRILNRYDTEREAIPGGCTGWVEGSGEV